MQRLAYQTPFDLSPLLVEEQESSKLHKDEKECAQAQICEDKNGPFH